MKFSEFVTAVWTKLQQEHQWNNARYILDNSDPVFDIIFEHFNGAKDIESCARHVNNDAG